MHSLHLYEYLEGIPVLVDVFETEVNEVFLKTTKTMT